MIASALRNGRPLMEELYKKLPRQPTLPQRQSDPSYQLVLAVEAALVKADCVFRKDYPLYTAKGELVGYLDFVSQDELHAITILDSFLDADPSEYPQGPENPLQELRVVARKRLANAARREGFKRVFELWERDIMKDPDYWVQHLLFHFMP